MKKVASFFIMIVLLVGAMFIPIYETEIYADQEYDVKSYILLDYDSGTILKSYNENQRLEIASMVKLMTTLLLIQKIEDKQISLEDKFIASEYAASMEGSQAFLDAHSEYSVKDLLKSIIVSSANDSSVVVAEAIGGSEQNFVQMLNDKAKQLKMTNTLYANCTGLPSTNQYSCAKDTAILLTELIKHPLYFDFSKIWMDEIIHKDNRMTELVNTNRLIRTYNGCDIGKTGFTDEAGYCLSASAKRNDMRLIAVVIGAKDSKSRFEITSNLLNYGFNNYTVKKVADSIKPLEEIVLKKGQEKYAKVYLANDYYYICNRNDKCDIEVKYKLPSSIKAPLFKNDKIATAYITKDGVVIHEIDIVVKDDYKKMTYRDSIHKIISNW